MIDWNRVRELRDEIGADDLAEVAQMFLAEAEDVVIRLETATDTAIADLHFLKGSAVNLGLVALSQTCAEEEARLRRHPDLMPDFAAIRAMFDAARVDLLAGLDSG